VAGAVGAKTCMAAAAGCAAHQLAADHAVGDALALSGMNLGFGQVHARRRLVFGLGA
jgi:hypothetical protein